MAIPEILAIGAGALLNFVISAVKEKGLKIVDGLLKAGNKLLKGVQFSIGPMNFIFAPVINSNNGLMTGIKEAKIEVVTLTRPLTDKEQKDMAKFNQLLLETFTKNGGALKSTAYKELESNTLMKKARSVVSKEAYQFIIDKLPVADQSMWLAALIVKSQQKAHNYDLANLMQAQIAQLKGQTGTVITNLLLTGHLENTLLSNYKALTDDGKLQTGEKNFDKLYQQLVHEMPKVNPTINYSGADKAQSLTQQVNQKVAANPEAVKTSLSEQLQKAQATVKAKVQTAKQEIAKNQAQKLS